MKVFCDTSVLVAAAVPAHEHHGPAFALVERVVSKRLRGFIAAHSLAETYAVLTRLPLSPPLQPEHVARLIMDNLAAHFSVRTLDAADYLKLVKMAGENRLPGGMIYDALLIACAKKAQADRVYTFNVAHFRRIAPELQKSIMAP